VVGVVHEEINLNSPSGIIHGHLIVLVRNKHVLRAIQNAMNDFLRKLKNIYFSKFSTALLTRSLTHSLTDAFSQVLRNTSYSFAPLAEILGEKTFHNIKCLRVCTGLLQF